MRNILKDVVHIGPISLREPNEDKSLDSDRKTEFLKGEKEGRLYEFRGSSGLW